MLLEPDQEHVLACDPGLEGIKQPLRRLGVDHDVGRGHEFGNDADELLPLDVMPDRDQRGDKLCRDHGRLGDPHEAAVDTAKDEDQFAAAGQRQSAGPGPKAAADQRHHRMDRRVDNRIRGR